MPRVLLSTFTYIIFRPEALSLIEWGGVNHLTQSQHFLIALITNHILTCPKTQYHHYYPKTINNSENTKWYTRLQSNSEQLRIYIYWNHVNLCMKNENHNNKSCKEVLWNIIITWTCPTSEAESLALFYWSAILGNDNVGMQLRLR